MKLLIKTLIQKFSQFIITSRSKKLAKELLNLTDKQLTTLGLNRYVIAQKLAKQNRTMLNVNKINVVITTAHQAVNVSVERSANDDKILSAA